jgi:hypothetical protein
MAPVRLTPDQGLDADALAHISPARSFAANYYGLHHNRLRTRTRTLNEKGHRPLRTVSMDDPEVGL